HRQKLSCVYRYIAHIILSYLLLLFPFYHLHRIFTSDCCKLQEYLKMFEAQELQAKRQGRLRVELHVRTFCSCECDVLVVRLQTFEWLTQTAFFVLYPVHRVVQFKYLRLVETLRQAQYITCRVDIRIRQCITEISSDGQEVLLMRMVVVVI